MRTRASLLALVLVMAPAAHVSAQRPADVVRWTASTPEPVVAAGASVRIDLTADLQEGWHLYALTQPKGGPTPLTFAVRKGQPFSIRARDITAPAPRVIKDPNFDLSTHQYDSKVTFRVPVTAERAATPGAQAVPLEITFQACGNGICLRPFTQTLSVDLTVAPPAAAR